MVWLKTRQSLQLSPSARLEVKAENVELDSSLPIETVRRALGDSWGKDVKVVGEVPAAVGKGVWKRMPMVGWGRGAASAAS